MRGVVHQLRSGIRWSVLGIALGLTVLAASAEVLGEERNHAALKIQSFSQTDGKDEGGGNPHVDESYSVIEPAVVVQASSGDFTGKAKFTADLIQGDGNQAVTTSASSNRFAGNLFPSYRLGRKTTLGGMLGMSYEYNYNSLQGGMEFGRSLLEGNLDLKVGITAFIDRLKVIRFDDTDEGWTDKQTWSFSFSASHVFSPQFLARLVATYTRQNGFLAQPGGFVVATDPSTGTELWRVHEALPGIRNRLSMTLEGRHHLSLGPGGSLALAYRFYGDDYHILAHTLEVSYRQYVWKKRTMVRVRLRYYGQGESSHFDSRPSSVRRYRTQDPIQSRFQSLTAGLKIVFLAAPVERAEGMLDQVDFDLSLDYYGRDDGIDGIFGSFGITYYF
ncbi:MAG: DUF3570 domain-containing protein [Planctomycetota bacterium]|jgi:hypothetical protein